MIIYGILRPGAVGASDPVLQLSSAKLPPASRMAATASPSPSDQISAVMSPFSLVTWQEGRERMGLILCMAGAVGALVSVLAIAVLASRTSRPTPNRASPLRSCARRWRAGKSGASPSWRRSGEAEDAGGLTPAKDNNEVHALF